MWAVLTLLLFLDRFSSANVHQEHLQELRKSFPYGLLTDDFGILDKQDLKTNTCIAQPKPFLEGEMSSSYPYWQCFEVKNSKMNCESGNYDEHEKVRMAMLVLSGIRDGQLHEFISRRPISIQSCRHFQKDWDRFTKNQKFVCISGSEPSGETEGGKRVSVWIFGRYKTRKGCDSYFQGECSSNFSCGQSD